MRTLIVNVRRTIRWLFMGLECNSTSGLQSNFWLSHGSRMVRDSPSFTAMARSTACLSTKCARARRSRSLKRLTRSPSISCSGLRTAEYVAAPVISKYSALGACAASAPQLLLLLFSWNAEALRLLLVIAVYCFGGSGRRGGHDGHARVLRHT